jgi:hypothetical protein
MEQHLCVVCWEPCDTGSLLIDERLRNSFDPKTVTGLHGLCEEHQKLYDDGYFAMVEVSNPENTSGDVLKNQDAERTGRIIHIRFEVAERLFNQPVQKKGGKYLPMSFISTEAADKLQQMSSAADSKD